MADGGRSPLVLVADDDPSTVFLVSGLLNRAGFRTTSASSTFGAMRTIREQTPDLVLLDVNLEDGPSYQTCRSLQSSAPASCPPVLFISANDDTTAKVQGFESGGLDYITKPISGPELVARVRTHLRLRRAYDRLAELQAERIEKLATAQQTIMPEPQDYPEAKFEVSIRQTLTVGGDFYDVIPVGPGMFDYLVADSCGHDLAASFWTAALKALVAEYASPLNSAQEIVSTVDKGLRRIMPSGAFITMLYARLNFRTGALTLVSAGHPPAVVVRAGAAETEVVRQEGDALAAFPDGTFDRQELQLAPGDRVYLYTDGLIELGGAREQGIARLAAACQERQALPLGEAVATLVCELTKGAAVEDDTLMLAIER